jgi:hypothetical protein
MSPVPAWNTDIVGLLYEAPDSKITEAPCGFDDVF